LKRTHWEWLQMVAAVVMVAALMVAPLAIGLLVRWFLGN
jgi:maltodextrin utilization protein YvdJ